MHVSEPVDFIQNYADQEVFKKAISVINELKLWEWLSKFNESIALTPSTEMRRINTEFTVRGIPSTKGYYTYIIHNMIYIAVHGFQRWKNAVILDQNEIALRKHREQAAKLLSYNAK